MKSESKKVEAGDDVAPELPITPMLDLSFQLLFFFIPLFNPTQEGQLDLALPSKEEKQAHKDPDPKTATDPEPTADSDLTLIVQSAGGAETAGQISAVFLEERTGRTPVVTDAANATVLAALKAKLEAVRTPKDAAGKPIPNPQPAPPTSVKLAADSRTKWSEMVKLVDLCRAAGFANVNFGQPPDLDLSAVAQ